MKFRRLQILWRETTGDGVTAEPSEVRLRTLLLGAAMLFGPPLLLLLYVRVMFPGLVNSDALDFAQLGRNLAAGRGFVTYVLRPLALTHGTNPLRQPDVTHGPLFPLILALAFGAFGAKDIVAAGVSGLFYLLTIPVLYRLGVRMFDRTVGLIVAVIFSVNALVLEYAASGLHITLYVFLSTWLLLAIHEMAVQEPKGGAATPFLRGRLLLCGVLAGLLYLTEPVFFWAVPVILFALVWLHPSNRLRAALTAGLPALLVMGPWMLRNWALTGDPVFGLRGLEVWMSTSAYPGLTAYRMLPADLTPGIGVLNAVVKKILLTGGDVIQTFPQVTASWMLAFFLPSLLFRFNRPGAAAVRSVTMGVFFALFFGMLLFHVEMPLFVATIPAMLVFAVAFLLHLIGQARLTRSTGVVVAVLVALFLVYPLLSDMALIEKTPALAEAGAARRMREMSRRDDVSFSDQPWIAAWFADRPSVWIPQNDMRMADLRERFGTARWLFLTQQVRAYSPEWELLYDQFAQWNAAALRARAGEGKPVGIARIPPNASARTSPLLASLGGFTAVEPGEHDAPTSVLAALPVPADARTSKNELSGRLATSAGRPDVLVK